MADDSRDASTTGMKGEGFYDAHSEYQRRVIEAGDELIRDAAGSLKPGSGGPITIVDYGSGTGATSVRAVETAIAAIRKAGADRPLEVIHNDVPDNDFTQLFRNVAGTDGYLQAEGGPVYALAAAGSFFEQVIPDGSADLGMCSNASHWLRHQPSARIPDGMYFCEAAGGERESIADQAAEDWLSFLSARARELRPGGRLVVQGIGSDDSGERVSASRLLRVMWRAADQLAGAEMLDRQTLEDYVFPVYCRSPAEARRPLEPGGELAGELEVITERLDEVPSPYWEAYERSSDAGAYADTYVEFVRAFAESTMLANLFKPGARDIDPAELCDRYFDTLRGICTETPDEGRYEAWILRLVIARR
jgi:cyclopropane-fatty-acyl-phospholipid synthase